MDGTDARVTERFREVAKSLSHMKKTASMSDARSEQKKDQDKQRAILTRHLAQKNLGRQVFDRVEEDFLKFRLWQDTKVRIFECCSLSDLRVVSVG